MEPNPFLSDDGDCRVLVQGITGREASMVTRHMIAYGTSVVAGVSPGRGGQDFEGVPVYNSVREALMKRAATASLVYVPPAAVRDAVLEALGNSLPLAVVVTERVPQKDTIYLIARARANGARIIGPNVTGLIVPRKKIKIGPIGGERPERTFSTGNVAIISRSGGMTSEIAWMLKREGLGISVAVSIGGDPIVGTSMKEMLEMLKDDSFTKAVVLFCEPGGYMESEVARFVAKRGIDKPLVALVAGRFTESLPRGIKFGHAGAIIQTDEGLPSTKLKMFRQSGIRVAERLSQIPAIAKELS